MKAWAMSLQGRPEVVSYQAAKSAGRARYLTFLRVSDPLPDVKIHHFKAVRAPQYDYIAVRGGERYLGYSEHDGLSVRGEIANC